MLMIFSKIIVILLSSLKTQRVLKKYEYPKEGAKTNSGENYEIFHYNIKIDQKDSL